MALRATKADGAALRTPTVREGSPLAANRDWEGAGTGSVFSGAPGASLSNLSRQEGWDTLGIGGGQRRTDGPPGRKGMPLQCQ